MQRFNNLLETMTAMMDFARYKHGEYPFLAIQEETGEFAGVIAKMMRKFGYDWMDYIDDEAKDRLQSELGDVLWQWLACHYELGLNPDETVDKLDAKLTSRAQRNVIVGEGDNR